MSERESSPEKAIANQPASSTEQTSPVPKKAQRKPLPDWKPLGSIRDYFAEQIRQDGLR
jgi:hypothetical protein